MLGHERLASVLPTPLGKLTIAQRRVLDTLLYIAKESCTWRGLPKEFGHWHTIYMRLSRWAKAGVLQPVVSERQRDQLAAQELDALLLDSRIMLVACAWHGRPANKERQAIGRSRSLPLA